MPRSQSTLTPLAQQITALPSIPPPTLVPTALAVPMGMLPVVMTTHDITWGTRAAEALEQHAFVTAYMPADQVPADAVQNVEDLKDQHITRSLIAGEIVRVSDLREQPYPPGVRPDDMAVSEIPRSWLANDASTLLPWTPVQIRVLLFNMDRLVSISLPPSRVMQADSTSLSVALPLDQHVLFDRLTAAGRESFISFSLTPLDSDPALNNADNAVAFAPEESGSCGRVAVETHDSPWNSPLPQGTITRGFSSTHTGIDFEAPRGSSVQAASTGRVLFAGYSSWGYGNTVVLSHGALITLYAHMDEILVACGQLVQAGDIVGTLGSTGNSSGPHLHFEIRQDDSTIDPLLLPALAEQQGSAGQVLPP
ncbi:MAG: peptidoglycan DD-metalloendopeptidase family protein [Anaerolineae bacterium]|nr:peptidoglycan DD-metalloendopeptidase family protein [Anaerolineae bacterium]